MASSTAKRDPLRLMWRRVLGVLLLFGTLFLFRGVWNVSHKESESRVLKVESQTTLADLRQRERNLRAEIANLRSEQGVEAELRERYDLAKEGEGVVVIIDPPAAAPVSMPSPLDELRQLLTPR